jgi:hypothetical protein
VKSGEALRILVLASTLTGGCAMGVGYSNGYDGDYPPDAYVATTVPYYYDGYPTYYYGNQWYYRDGGRWRHYDHEPEALRQNRIQASPVRRNFEPSVRGNSGRATGGWRGGHR